MTGEITMIGSDLYIHMNKSGTLEKISGRIHWYHAIYIYIKQRSKRPLGLEELRTWFYARRMHFSK